MLTVMITLSEDFSLLVLNLSGLWTTSVKPPTPLIWNMTCGIKHMIISVGFYVQFNVRMSITVSAIAFIPPIQPQPFLSLSGSAYVMSKENVKLIYIKNNQSFLKTAYSPGLRSLTVSCHV